MNTRILDKELEHSSLCTSPDSGYMAMLRPPIFPSATSYTRKLIG